MKKNLLITGACVASLFDVSCFGATTIKPYVGANVAITGVAWTNELKDMTEDLFELPTSFWGMGFDFGARFANDNIYNCGLTLAYDYVFDSKARITSYAKPYISSVKTGFSAFGLTFDNYLRVSEKDEKRGDIVLGLGLANIKERIYLLPTAAGIANGLEKTDARDNGGAFILKIGYNSKIDDNWDWNITGRWFITSGDSDEKDFDAMFILSFGARYVF